MRRPAAVAAIQGALGFLTRLPVGRREADWAALRARPVAFPVTGYVVGAILLPVVVLPLPAATTALAFVGWVYVVTGVNHVDGLADLGDAMVVHGDAARRRAVMADTTTGVGAVLAVALVVTGLALAGASLAALPLRAAGVLVAAEVGAKLGMAALVCFGSAAHDGLGARFTRLAGPRSLAVPALVSAPVVLVSWPHPAPAVALVAGLLAALAVLAWARRRLGGVSGDVIGAANEVARVVALHAGVVAWTRW